ncbi:YidB family protein [Variovorax sp. J2P1-59]|uniref:OmpA family protein n=1 Tax=Variovorax flavidus TaxID=3053501 RepID=UPI0025789076|nr:YidB family protein [Variovorax sp. J2P1-59]MDM0078049.1 YidB family protein [Variovorax sp. J2P1-59]
MFDEIIHQVSERFGLGDKAGPLVQMLVASMIQPQTGELSGFLERISKAGIGQVVESWFSGGDAEPHQVSSRQVDKLLGGHGGLLEAVQTRLGIGRQVATAALAFALPPVITYLMPNGNAPASAPQEVMAFASPARNWLLGNSAASRADKRRPGLIRALAWLVLALVVVLLLDYCATQSREDQVAAVPTESVPMGSGILASLIDGTPGLKVYFDTGKADLPGDFAAHAAAVISHLSTHTDATLIVSGFSDPSGSVAANKEMSKRRAMVVADALIAAGVPEDRIVLERPTDIIGTGTTDAASRRVEVIVRK